MLEDRVRDVTTTTGAGTTIALAGTPPDGFVSFDIFADGSTVRFVDTDGNDYETWTGVYDALTLTKVILEESSQSNNPINWTGGTQRVVFCGPTARDVSYQLPTFMGTTGGSANAQTLTPATVLRAYRAGRFMRVVWGFTNTGAMTLQVSGLATPRAVMKAGPGGLQGLEGREAIAGNEGDIFDTGSAFILLNPTPVGSPIGAGILTRTGSTSLLFAPKNGFLIPVNKIMRPIPAAGIAGGAASVFVDGVGASNLAINTDYLVTLFENSGAPTYDYLSTLTHAPSATQGNLGVEIPGTDDTRSVIGLIHTDGSGHFVDTDAQRFVASWYNRHGKSMAGANISSTSGVTSPTELNSSARLEAVVFDKDSVAIGVAGYMSNVTPGCAIQSFVSRDGIVTSVFVNPFNGVSVGGAASLPTGGTAVETPGEGYHYWTVVGNVNAGTGTWNMNLTGEMKG